MSYKEKSLLYFVALITASLVYYQVEKTERSEQTATTDIAQLEYVTPSQNNTNTQILP